MSQSPYSFDNDDEAMNAASEEARRTFRFFWREISWENRRVVPGLDLAMVKLPFTDGPRTDGNPDFELMWVSQVSFDGETVSGELVNSPHWLTSVKEGEVVQMPFSRVSDWMIAAEGKVFGGYTVQRVRASLDARQRKEHDEAWGLDFGDPDQVRLEVWRSRGGFISKLFGGGKNASGVPTEFRDHPMCLNMLETYDRQMGEDPSVARDVLDEESGFTLLHSEALAGNLGMVHLLVKHGADVGLRTRSGRTAAELARGIGWNEIADLLDGLAVG